MIEFLSSLDTPLRIFWVIAIAASAVFLIQAVITFAGVGADSDFCTVDDVDSGDAGYGGLFSFRNLINFLLGYGWSGVILYDHIQSRFWLYFVCILIGLLFILAFVLMFKAMLGLAHDGSFYLESAIGKAADVYLRIPAARSGRGKVQVSVNGSVHEIDAVTDDADEVPTGGKVQITDVIGDDCFLVKIINK